MEVVEDGEVRATDLAQGDGATVEHAALCRARHVGRDPFPADAPAVPTCRLIRWATASPTGPACSRWASRGSRPGAAEACPARAGRLGPPRGRGRPAPARAGCRRP